MGIWSMEFMASYLGVALVDGMGDGLHKVVPETPVWVGVPQVATLSFTGRTLQHGQQGADDQQKHGSTLAQGAGLLHIDSAWGALSRQRLSSTLLTGGQPPSPQTPLHRRWCTALPVAPKLTLRNRKV